MANTDSNKSSGKSQSNKANKSSANNKRSASAGNRTKESSDKGRRTNGGGNRSYMPSMTATVASLVGAGVALGFGLFATRNRWMPYAEDMNDRIHDRWDSFASRNDDNDDDHDENGSDYSSDYRAKTDSWSKGSETAAASNDTVKMNP
jgi:hypothetical protein